MATLSVGLWSALGAGGAAAAEKPKPVDFNRDVLPILSDNCFACHGPDANKRDADLRVDTKEALLADRGGYHIVTPGKAETSELFKVISTQDDFELMPPSSSNLKLKPEQIELIRRGIEEGASYSEHWAYVAPKRPEVPGVKQKGWVRNPIDSFILARLEAEGLRPSAEADRATLLRRVSFDLTGLPPTPEEVTAFLKDRSANAYEKQVDRLLASPRYGEHMALMWLDLARYADSGGGPADPLRAMWLWRDWVINAYNNNLPYDQFTIKQIAGDLLPGATLQDRIATGFNRNHDGAPDEENDRFPIEDQERASIVANRVSTTGTVWLGLTVGCARCHDHKFDPIKQKDFYQLAAYFNNVPEYTSWNHDGNTEPVVSAPTPEQLRQAQTLDAAIRAALSQLPEKEMAKRENQWRTTAAETIPPAPREGLLAYYPFENTLADRSGHGHDGHLLADQISYLPGVTGRSGVFNINGTTAADFGNFADFDRNTPFALSFWINTRSPKAQNVLQKHAASPNWQGLEIALQDPQKFGRRLRIVVRLANRWPDNAIEIRSKERVIVSQHPPAPNLLGTTEQHLVLNYDGSGKAAGLKLYLDGKLVETEISHDELTRSSKTSAPLSLGEKKFGDQSSGQPFKGAIDELRIYNRVLSEAEIDNLHTDAPALELTQELRGRPVTEIPDLRETHPPQGFGVPDPPPEAVDAFWQRQQQERLSDYFLSHATSQPIRQSYARLKELRARKAELDKTIPTTMVMAEMDSPMDTFVLGRGEFSNKKEKVAPGVPAFLLTLPKGAPANRLGLARWLVDPNNPLTARVEVNRYWAHLFGTGIVKTAEDFGSQGERPTHPALLDWLATEFIRSGWDTKGMQRLIVLSATYRQSSRTTPQMRDIDPENRLYGRGPRVRLTGEEIRDNALTVSGLLTDKRAGPSVYPYQPVDIWPDPADSFYPAVYTQSTGADLYRRSVYVIWRRGAPVPTLATLDVPDREVCVARRIRTNTPLQALVLMDDPTYVEAGRMFAQRAILEAGSDPRKRLDFLFRWALERKPSNRERDLLVKEAEYLRAHFRQEPQAARLLLNIGMARSDPRLEPSELAAWTTVSRTILNMDETISKQ